MANGKAAVTRTLRERYPVRGGQRPCLRGNGPGLLLVAPAVQELEVPVLLDHQPRGARNDVVDVRAGQGRREVVLAPGAGPSLALGKRLPSALGSPVVEEAGLYSCVLDAELAAYLRVREALTGREARPISSRHIPLATAPVVLTDALGVGWVGLERPDGGEFLLVRALLASRSPLTVNLTGLVALPVQFCPALLVARAVSRPCLSLLLFVGVVPALLRDRLTRLSARRVLAAEAAGVLRGDGTAAQAARCSRDTLVHRWTSVQVCRPRGCYQHPRGHFAAAILPSRRRARRIIRPRCGPGSEGVTRMKSSNLRAGTAGMTKVAHDPGDPLVTSHCLARSVEVAKWLAVLTGRSGVTSV